MRPRTKKTASQGARRPLLTSLFGLLVVCASMACSGAYTAADDSELVTFPDRTPSTNSGPLGPPVLPRDESTSDAGVASEAGTGTSIDAAKDAPSDASAMGCLEPEPNDNPAAAPVMPNPFTCGRLTTGDVDYFIRVAAPGERVVRIVSPAGPAGEDLSVTVRFNGSTLVLGRGDTMLGVTQGVKYTFEVRSVSNTSTSYGILFESS